MFFENRGIKLIGKTAENLHKQYKHTRFHLKYLLGLDSATVSGASSASDAVAPAPLPPEMGATSTDDCRLT